METVLLISSPPDGVTSSVIRRPASANYHPSLWGDYFIKQQFPPSTIQKSEAWIKQRVEELIMKIKIMLTESTDDQLQEMQWIDALQRLGIAYHFEKEIDDELRRIHNAKLDSSDLNFVSLRFRLLRQHGYNTPSDVFNKFKDGEGNFQSSLCEQVRDLLSLYEAAYLSIPGEDILDDALEFTKRHLEYYSMESNYLEPIIAAHISHSLQTPLRRKVERLQSRQYINIYEKDDEIRNDYLLELAKLDFHLFTIISPRRA